MCAAACAAIILKSLILRANRPWSATPPIPASFRD